MRNCSDSSDTGAGRGGKEGKGGEGREGGKGGKAGFYEMGQAPGEVKKQDIVNNLSSRKYDTRKTLINSYVMTEPDAQAK